MISLTVHQISILNHTENRAANKHFFGESDDMNFLVDNGLMKFLYKSSISTDKVFTITALGLETLKECKK